MTGLEALKRIKSHYNDRVCIDILEDFDNVEKELKRLEELKEKYTSLERAFNSLSKDDEKAKKLLSKEIEKNKALEIIKSYPHLVKIILETVVTYGKDNVKNYDLLKEVLYE